MSTTGKASNVSEMETQVIVPQFVRMKMDRIVALSPKEVYWFGCVDNITIGDETFLRIYDVLIPKQEVSSTSVDMHGTMNELMEELIEKGEEDKISDIKAFCHSHVNMGVYHSSTDMEMLMDIATKLELPWFISLVFNKEKKYDGRIDFFTEKPLPMHVGNKVNLLNLIPAEVEDWVRTELDKKVSQKQYQVGFTRGGTSGTSTSSGKPSTSNSGAIKGFDFEAARKEAREKYEDDGYEQIYVRFYDGCYQTVCDNWIAEEMDPGDGSVLLYALPTKKKIDEAKLEESIKRQLQAGDNPKAMPPVKGDPTGVQVGEILDFVQGRLLPIQGLRTPRSVSGAVLLESNGSVKRPLSESQLQEILENENGGNTDEFGFPLLTGDMTDEEWTQALQHYYGSE